MLRAFYHSKKFTNTICTLAYEKGTAISKIKSDMRHYNVVLDAVYNSDTNKVTLYSKNLTKENVYYSLPFFEYLAKKEGDNV